VTDPLRLVTFRRSGVAYGVPVGCVRRVLRAPPVRALPAAPPFVPGGVSVDGRLEALVDPASLLDPETPPAGAARVVLVTVRARGFALVADEAGEVLEVDAGARQAVPPFLGASARSVLTGVVVRDGEDVLLLDPERLLERTGPETARTPGPAAPEGGAA
jgi:purine-binding chemotaxis protein CheW